jgi:hypothetical protein
MTEEILSEASLETKLALFPLATLRDVCNVGPHKNEALKRALAQAISAAEDLGQCSLFPTSRRVTYLLPSLASGYLCDKEGVSKSVLLTYGPVKEITKVAFVTNVKTEMPLSIGQIVGSHYLKWNKPILTAEGVVLVEYNAGFLTIPEEVKGAVLDLLAILWDARGGEWAPPSSCKRVLGKYRPSRTAEF